MENITPLCEIAYKYGTDKCPQIKHVYTPYYYKLFNERKRIVKKVLEMGIGNYKDMKHVDTCYDPALKRTYHRGASLHMWREFFPNALIYGADVLPDTMFTDERITTYLCDETKDNELRELIRKVGSDTDLFVDDGLHTKEAQIYMAQTVMPLLDKDVTYIIEDVGFPDHIKLALSNYNVECPHLPERKYQKGRLMVIKHK